MSSAWNATTDAEPSAHNTDWMNQRGATIIAAVELETAMRDATTKLDRVMLLGRLPKSARAAADATTHRLDPLHPPPSYGEPALAATRSGRFYLTATAPSDLRLVHWNVLADGLAGSTPIPSDDQQRWFEAALEFHQALARANDLRQAFFDVYGAEPLVAPVIEPAELTQDMTAYIKNFKKPNGGFVGQLNWLTDNQGYTRGDELVLAERTPSGAPMLGLLEPIGARADRVVAVIERLVDRHASIVSLVENDRPFDILHLLERRGRHMAMLWAPKPDAPTRKASKFGEAANPDGPSLLYDPEHAHLVAVAVALLPKNPRAAGVLLQSVGLPADDRLVCVMPPELVAQSVTENVLPLDIPAGFEMARDGKPLYKQLALYACFDVPTASGESRRIAVASAHLESDKTALGETIRANQAAAIRKTLGVFARAHDAVAEFLMMDANAAPTPTEPEKAAAGEGAYPPLCYAATFEPAPDVGPLERARRRSHAVAMPVASDTERFVDLLPDEPYTTAKAQRRTWAGIEPTRMHTIDYIGVRTHGAQLSRVWRLVWPTSLHKFWRTGADLDIDRDVDGNMRMAAPFGDLPNGLCPSDHLPLAVDVAFDAGAAAMDMTA